jgi:hypothetical protein
MYKVLTDLMAFQKRYDLAMEIPKPRYGLNLLIPVNTWVKMIIKSWSKNQRR